MKNLIISAVLAVSSLAFAGTGKAPAQTHHCEVDGKEVAKTHKECSAAKGKWVKGAPAAAAGTTGGAAAGGTTGGTAGGGTTGGADAGK